MGDLTCLRTESGFEQGQRTLAHSLSRSTAANQYACHFRKSSRARSVMHASNTSFFLPRTWLSKAATSSSFCGADSSFAISISRINEQWLSSGDGTAPELIVRLHPISTRGTIACTPNAVMGLRPSGNFGNTLRYSVSSRTPLAVSVGMSIRFIYRTPIRTMRRYPANLFQPVQSRANRAKKVSQPG